MSFKECLEALLPFYKKHLANKIINKYEEIIKQRITFLRPLTEEEIKEFIFIDKIIQNPFILYNVLYEFKEKFNNRLIENDTNNTKKIKNITFSSICDNPMLLNEFIVEIYYTLKYRYSET